MSRKGFSVVVILLVVAGVLAAGGGTYWVLNKRRPDPLEGLSEEAKEEVEKELAGFNRTMDKFEAGIDAETIETYVESEGEVLREELEQKANDILSRDPCKATMDDVREALEAAAEAMSLGEEELGDRLLDWAKRAFREVAARESVDLSGPLPLDEMDLEAAGPGEIEEAAEEGMGIMKQRAILAEQAQRLGMIEVSDKLIKGKVVSSKCPWKVEVAASYEGSMEGNKEFWVNEAKFEEVPADASVAAYENRAEGRFIESDFAYFDGAEWISGEPKGKVWWSVDFSPAESDSILLKVEPEYYESDVYVQYPEGAIAESAPIGGLVNFEKTSFTISLEKLRKRESFSLKQELEFEDGKGQIEIEFTP